MSIQVIPIAGEPLRFHATSESDSDTQYLVDLECFGTNGKCGCQQFTMRIEPKLISGELYEGECKHLAAVWRYFGRAMAKRIVAEIPKTQGNLDESFSGPSEAVQSETTAREDEPF